jgi:hypothetical protein
VTEIKKEAFKKKWKVGKKENEIESKIRKKYYFRLVIGTERV